MDFYCTDGLDGSFSRDRENGHSFPLGSFLCLIVLFMVFVIWLFIKIKYSFWSRQPVYHTYDWIWSASPYIIHPFGIVPTKYHDPLHTKTYPYNDLDETQKTLLVDFLHCHAIPSDCAFIKINQEQLHTLLTNSPTSSFVSFYHDGDSLLGCMYSIPYHLTVESTYSYPCAYIDTICVHHSCSERSWVLKMLETHLNHQEIASITLVKKEGNLARFDGVVPIVQYTTMLVKLSVLAPPRKLPHGIFCQPLDATLMEPFLDHAPFRVVLRPMIRTLINQQEMYAFCLRQGKATLAYYFFRNGHTQYEYGDGDNKDRECDTLICVGSCFFGTGKKSTNINLFWEGWLHAIRCITANVAENAPNYTHLLVDGTSHNEYLIRRIDPQRVLPSTYVDTALFAHNLIIPHTPFLPKECLCL